MLRVLLALSFLMISASTSFASYVYVDDSGPNDPGSGTAEDPFRHLATAVAGSIDGDEIRVAQGNYPLVSTLDLSNRILRGGFPGYGQPGTWETQVADNTSTTISGADYLRCFVINSANHAVLDNLSICTGEVLASANVWVESVRFLAYFTVKDSNAIHVESSVVTRGLGLLNNVGAQFVGSRSYSNTDFRYNVGSTISGSEVSGDRLDVSENVGSSIHENQITVAASVITENSDTRFDNNRLSGNGYIELSETPFVQGNVFDGLGMVHVVDDTLAGLPFSSPAPSPMIVRGNTFLNIDWLDFVVYDNFWYFFVPAKQIVVEDNEILSTDGTARTGVHIVGNIVFQDNVLESSNQLGTALQVESLGDVGTIVRANNITGWETPFEDLPPHTALLGNLFWANKRAGTWRPIDTKAVYPIWQENGFNFLVNLFGISPSPIAYRNCSDAPMSPVPMYGYQALADGTIWVHSYAARGRYFRNLTDAEQTLGVVFSRSPLPLENFVLSTPPVDPRGKACGGIGVGGFVDAATTKMYAGARPANAEPQVVLSRPQLDVNVGAEIALEYRLYGGGPVTDITWTQVMGPPVELSNINSLGQAIVTLPSTGIYQFRLNAKEYRSPIFPVPPTTVEIRVTDARFTVIANGVVKNTYGDLQAAIDAALPGETVQLPMGRFTRGEGFPAKLSINNMTDLTIQGAGAVAGIGSELMFFSAGGLSVMNSVGIVIRNVRVLGPDASAISVENSEVQFEDVSFEQVTASPTALGQGSTIDAIYAVASKVSISGSYFSRLRAGVSLRNCSQGLIEKNRFDTFATEAIYIDNSGCDSPRITVRDNLFDLQQASRAAVYVKNFQAPNGSLEIVNNVVTDAPLSALHFEGPVSTATPVRIEGNTFGGDSRWGWANGAGINIKGSGDFDIAYNTIYGFARSAIYNAAGAVGAWNNVLTYSADGYGIENNAMSCVGASCAPKAWAANNLTYRNTKGNYLNVDLREGGIEADPLFANPDAGNFTFAGSSPLSTLDVGARNRAPLPGPENVKTEPGVESVTLTFDPVPGSQKYTVYWGTVKGAYPQSTEIGLHTSAKIPGLAARPYYFVVRAHDGFREGEPSVAKTETPLSGHVWSVVEVDGVKPSRVPSRKDIELVVFGSGFVEGAKVFAGSTRAEVIEVKPTKLKVRFSKPLNAGLYPISVVNPDLGRGALSKALTVFDPAKADASAGCASGKSLEAWLIFAPLGILIHRRLQRARLQDFS